MSISPVVVELCPQPLVASSLSLLMKDLEAGHRHAFLTALGSEGQPGLFIARQGQAVVGVCWAQPQPGNTAIFWPPQVTGAAGAELANSLAQAAVAALDRRGCGLAQVLLNERDEPGVTLLEKHQFSYLAELLYLGVAPERGEAPLLPDGCDLVGNELEFQSFQPTEVERMVAIIQRTYEQTLDCPELDGARPMEDVLAGYLATGSFDPNLWMFIRHKQADVGVLLLTKHPENGTWELVYMGLVPEIRGKAWGLAIVHHAKCMASAADVERLVLAVDAANAPAVKMYELAGFTEWDHRHVMVRLPQTATA